MGGGRVRTKDGTQMHQTYKRLIRTGLCLVSLFVTTNISAEAADRLLSGRGIIEDPTKANAVLTTAASKGNAGAATKLGHIASESKNYVEALKHYRIAANLGEPTAMLCIGIQYKNGWGVTRDDAEALSWLRKAAEGGSDYAKQILSQLNN